MGPARIKWVVNGSSVPRQPRKRNGFGSRAPADDPERGDPPLDEPPQVESLVGRAVGGDAVALTMLLTQSRGGLCGYLGGRIPADLRGSIDADDVAQEAHVEVFRHIRAFEPRGPDSFHRWVKTIALRKLRDAIKARRAACRGGGRAAVGGGVAAHLEDSMVAFLDLLAGPDRTPSRSAARHEVVYAMQQAMTELPEDYRQAVWLVYIEGQPVAAAAERMGRTERAVHNLCYKAKDRLRDILGSRSRFFSSSG
jgi:RNA polymerase sigma-70 factor (ECF subfamily)